MQQTTDDHVHFAQSCARSALWALGRSEPERAKAFRRAVLDNLAEDGAPASTHWQALAAFDAIAPQVNQANG